MWHEDGKRLDNTTGSGAGAPFRISHLDAFPGRLHQGGTRRQTGASLEKPGATQARTAKKFSIPNRQG